ncbi:MAG: hypothetical protein AAFX99_30810 [Myxococcota bacterium]
MGHCGLFIPDALTSGHGFTTNTLCTVDQPNTPQPNHPSSNNRLTQRPILMLLLGLMLGAALAAGGGWFYMEQVKAKLYHELTVQARIEVEAFMTVTGELVRLYIDLSNLIAQKIGTLFYLQWDKGQVQPRVDTDAFQKEVLSTQVLTNLRRRVNRLKQLLALTSRGLTADLKPA